MCTVRVCVSGYVVYSYFYNAIIHVTTYTQTTKGGIRDTETHTGTTASKT